MTHINEGSSLTTMGEYTKMCNKIVLISLVVLLLTSCGGSNSTHSAAGTAKAFIEAWQSNDRAKLEQLLVPGYVSARDKIEAVSLQSAQITESLVEGNEKTADSLSVVLRGSFSYTDSGGEESASQCYLSLSKVNDGWRVGYVDCY